MYLLDLSSKVSKTIDALIFAVHLSDDIKLKSNPITFHRVFETFGSSFVTMSPLEIKTNSKTHGLVHDGFPLLLSICQPSGELCTSVTRYFETLHLSDEVLIVNNLKSRMITIEKDKHQAHHIEDEQ